MHTARQLDQTQFAITHHGRPVTREQLLPAWGTHDRLGVVMTEPFGAVGASHLIQLAITAFYDARPSRRAGRPDGVDPTAIYPDIYLFHVGGAYGDHSAYDFWPARKEVAIDRDPRVVLDAINDRAITRLVVPDVVPTEVQHEWKEPAAARDRIVTTLVYAADGRVRDAEWRVAGLQPTTEANVKRVLDPTKRYSAKARFGDEGSVDADLHARSWPETVRRRQGEAIDGVELARRRREALHDEGGMAAETYRSVSLDEALSMLA